MSTFLSSSFFSSLVLPLLLTNDLLFQVQVYFLRFLFLCVKYWYLEILSTWEPSVHTSLGIRLVSCSVLIRDASFCSRWEQIQWPPQLYNAQGVRNLERPSSIWYDVFMKSLPLGLRGLWEIGSRKNVRTSGNGRHQGNKAFRHIRTDPYMNSQRLCIAHTGPAQVQARWSLLTEEGNWT